MLFININLNKYTDAKIPIPIAIGTIWTIDIIPFGITGRNEFTNSEIHFLPVYIKKG